MRVMEQCGVEIDVALRPTHSDLEDWTNDHRHLHVAKRPLRDSSWKC